MLARFLPYSNVRVRQRLNSQISITILTEQVIDNQVRLLLSRSEQFLTVKLLNFISEGTIMKQTLCKKKTMFDTFEPRREKTNILHMRKQRRRSASSNREADQRFCFRCIESTIPLLSKPEISSLYQSFVAVQPGLCRTRSEPRTFVFSRRGSFLL